MNKGFSVTHSRTIRLVLAGLLASLISLAGIAASADAATIYACQKKKGGTIRIVSAKTKCKKSEKKISFNTVGKAGKDGANGTNGSNGAAGTNGTNGTNGANGSAGQPQSAISFSVSRAISVTKDTLFSAGGATVKFNCGTILFANIANVEVNSDSGTSEAGAIYTRTDNTPTQANQTLFYTQTLNGTDQLLSQVATNADASPLGNKGYVNGTIQTSSSVIFLSYFVQVNNGATACVVRGHALVIPTAP